MPDYKQIFLYVNIETGKLIYEDGSELATKDWPKFYLGDRVILCIHFMYSDLTDYVFGADETFELAIDNEFIHTITEGALTAAFSGAVTSITADGFSEAPPSSGTLTLANSSSESENVSYTSYTENAGVYTFVVSDTLTYIYANNDTCNIAEPLMVFSDNDQIDISGDWADIDRAEGKISVRAFCNTTEFEDTIADEESVPGIIEMKKYKSAVPSIILQDGCSCKNIINNDTPAPTSSDPTFYTASAVDSLLALGWNVEYSVNGSTLWHETQVEADRYYRLQPGAGVEWTSAIAMVVGPTGAAAPALEIQYSIDGSTLWHDTFASGDFYLHVSNDGGSTYGSAMKFIGDDGADGLDGAAGAAATIAVGTVTTGDAGTSVIVTNSGTEAAAIFDFTIPRGNTGANGNDTKLQYSADSVSWHDTYTAGDIYMHISTNGGSTYGAAMQFSSSGVNTPETFVDGDLTVGVLTVSGLRPIIAITDNSGKVIYPDEITYGATDTTVDLSSFGTLTGTWTVIFGQGKDGTDGTDGTDGADAPQDNWRVVGAGDFTATPASTSVLSMSDTSAVNIGDGVKYTDGRGTYYAVITALTTNTSITIAGAGFDTGSDVTALYVGNNKVIQQDFFISGAYGDGTGDLLAADMNTYSKWQGRKAYLVSFSAVHKTVDTGAAQPKINVKVNAAAVSTNDTNNGVQLSTAGAWVDNAAIAINTSNYDINRGEAIEITCTAAGTNGDASDLTVSLVFVQE